MTALPAEAVQAGALPVTAKRARRPWGVTTAAVFLSLVVLAAAHAPLLAPYAIDLSPSRVGTSGAHPPGTDASGQDLLSRVLCGARTSLIAPLLLLLLASVLGVTLGTVAAWRGGWADMLVSRTTDVMYAFPGLLFVVLITAVFGAGMTTSVIALGLAYAPTIAKYTRSVAPAADRLGARR